MTSACEVVVTPTGTKAMRDRATGEVMHPSGARLESERLYLEPSRLAARLGHGGKLGHQLRPSM